MNYVAVALLSVLLGAAVHFVYRWRLTLTEQATVKHLAALVALIVGFALWSISTTQFFPVHKAFLVVAGLAAIIPNIIWVQRQRRALAISGHGNATHHV